VDHPDEWHRFGPATLGSIYLAVVAGYERIGLVDGVFGNVPSVWHKEILFALSHGVAVYGSSSMGALRAAELHLYGMRGVGEIFRLYRNSTFLDDDEVCLIHAPHEGRYSPYSLPMVNIRKTLRRLRRTGGISRRNEQALSSLLKAAHFSERTYELLEIAVERVVRGIKARSFVTLFQQTYFDLKQKDYARLILSMKSGRNGAYFGPPWEQLETAKWAPQFVHGVADLPPLMRW
jgi:hypothetical protein